MDEDLKTLKRLAAGEESALNELMIRYREEIFRFCWRFTENVADAQELTEETFVRVYFNAGKFKPQASVKTWIFTITRNLCRDLIRRRKKHRFLQSIFASNDGEEWKTHEETLVEPSLDAASSLASDEYTDEIREAIRNLPEKLRFPFVCCALEGHSHEEAAAILKLSPKAVEMRIYRARKQLQKAIQSRKD